LTELLFSAGYKFISTRESKTTVYIQKERADLNNHKVENW